MMFLGETVLSIMLMYFPLLNVEFNFFSLRMLPSEVLKLNLMSSSGSKRAALSWLSARNKNYLARGLKFFLFTIASIF